jgi:hypothetical protein
VNVPEHQADPDRRATRGNAAVTRLRSSWRLANIANWAQSPIDGALSASGTSAAQIGMAKLGGVVITAWALFDGGATLDGLPAAEPAE